MTKAYAASVGIAVDHRRRNSSEESLELNKQRLLSYLSKLVVFPKNAKAPKKGESTDAAALKAASQVNLSQAFPIAQDSTIEAARSISSQEKEASAYLTTRKAWAMERYAGIRAKRAAEKAETVEKKEK